jgi:hypothetical protein
VRDRVAREVRQSATEHARELRGDAYLAALDQELDALALLLGPSRDELRKRRDALAERPRQQRSQRLARLGAGLRARGMERRDDGVEARDVRSLHRHLIEGGAPHR